MTEDFPSLFMLFFAWCGYFALHSALASLPVKHWVANRLPALMPAYRLGFNLLAAALLLPVLWLLYSHPGPALWSWRGSWAWLANGLALLAVAGFVRTLKTYDMQEFLGLHQLATHRHAVEEQEGLRISFFHRFVRHPWYFFGLVILWTRDMNGALLLSAILITLYLWAGSRLEERKLIVYYGDAYRRYRKRVPALFPLPWKFLSAGEADALRSEEGKQSR